MTEQTLSPTEFCEHFARIRDEMARVVVGQERAVEQLLVTVFAGGHALLTGMPGLGRTLLVQTLSDILHLSYRRIQFTPDLLPTDIVGTEVLECNRADDRRTFRFYKGPVFANLVLADEINRSPARTQAALLEVMQERQVTVGGQTYFLLAPFILIATQNNVETEGVWPLGEAQVDRFMMSIKLEYPPLAEERDILRRTTGARSNRGRPVASPEIILAMQRLAQSVPIVPSVKDFALAIVRTSRAGEPEAPAEIKRVIRLGASPRTAQALMLGAKVLALARGRVHATRQDVADLVEPVLRHRLLLDFRAKAEGCDFNYVLRALLRAVRERELPPVSKWARPLLKIAQV